MFREAGFVILNIGATEMGAGATCSLAGGGAGGEGLWSGGGSDQNRVMTLDCTVHGPGVGSLFKVGDHLGGVARIGADAAETGVVGADHRALVAVKLFP